jgi:hypothetical protein
MGAAGLYGLRRFPIGAQDSILPHMGLRAAEGEIGFVSL